MVSHHPRLRHALLHGRRSALHDITQSPSEHPSWRWSPIPLPRLIFACRHVSLPKPRTSLSPKACSLLNTVSLPRTYNCLTCPTLPSHTFSQYFSHEDLKPPPAQEGAFSCAVCTCPALLLRRSRSYKLRDRCGIRDVLFGGQTSTCASSPALTFRRRPGGGKRI